MRRTNRKAVLTAACLGLVAPSVFAVDFPETEPNETKALANLRTLSSGDSVSGTTTGSSTLAGATSADTFRIKTPAASLGIYRHVLALTATGTAGHTVTLRGLSQAGNVVGTADNVFQTGSSITSPARAIYWYGFGKEEEVYYRVTGTASTTGVYTSTLTSTSQSAAVNTGTVFAGNVRIQTSNSVGTQDNEVWLYDSNFNAIASAGADNVLTGAAGTLNGATVNSGFVRNLTPGTYYVAVAAFNLANNLASPTGDFATGTVLDFPNAIAGSQVNVSGSRTVNVGMTDAFGSPAAFSQVIFPANSSGVVEFVQFTVTAAPIPAGAGSASPNPVAQGASTTLTVTVTPAASSNLDNITSVIADISALTGNASPDNLVLTRNGVTADWTGLANVNIATTVGSKNIPFTITDSTTANGSGSFAVSVVVPPPANDTCAGAIAVSTGTTLGNNANGTSAGDPVPTCQTTSGKGLWYTFTAGPAGGTFQFDTNGSTQSDTVLTVFDACGGAQIACDDDTGTGNLSQLSLALTANQQIFVMVSTFGATPTGGAFNLNVTEITPPPANDLCANALTVSVGAPAATGSNAFATTAGDQLSTCISVQRSVWFDFTAPTAGTYTFDTEGSAQADTVLTVFGTCGGAEIDCDDESGTGSLSSLPLTLTAGQNIKIMLSTWSSATAGGYVLNIAPPPCVSFITQPLATSACAGTTASFTTTVSTTGTPAFQWQTAPVSAGPFTDLVDGPVAGLGTVSGATTSTLTITGVDLAATTTRFRVVATGDCGSGTSSNVALTVVDCPPNDTCANATVATLGTVTGNNTNATTVGDAIPGCQDEVDSGVWFTFTADPAGGTYLFDTEGSAQTDTVLTVFDACGGTELACDDDSGVSPANSSRLTITLAPSQEVRIQLSTFVFATPGGYTFNISNCTVISAQPTDATAAIGGTANFSVTAAGPGTLTYTWQRNPLGAGTFANLTDGVVAGLGTVSGATTANLSISNLEAAASTDQFRVVVGGSCTAINSTAAVLTVADPFPARCNGADIAYDDGTFLPRAEIVDGTNGTPAISGPSTGTNNGVTEADYNVFFANFFDANPVADIANDDGTSRVPTPAPGTVTNNGVTEGDYNYFFGVFFDGCSL